MREGTFHGTEKTGVGAMEMPRGFCYRDVFLKGKPRHEKDDGFLFRHPRMEHAKRAKIFAPFDALKGFDDALGAYARAAAGPEETDANERKG